MSFKHVGALDVRVNFLVRPAAFEELVRWVVRGLIVMVNPEILHHAPCCYSLVSLIHLIHSV